MSVPIFWIAKLCLGLCMLLRLECPIAQRSWFWQNCSNRPVLKHGPRSRTYVRVFGWQTLMRNESDSCLGQDCGQIPSGCMIGLWFHLWTMRVIACLFGPERWWTMPEQSEVRGNSDGSSKRYWRANRSSDLGIGAKQFYQVKLMIRGTRIETIWTYSQTLNG